MRRRFVAYDPRRRHPYRRVAQKAWIPDVVHAAPAFAGEDFEIIGRIVSSNLLRPISPRLGEWIIQLAPLTVESGIVYCRVTAPLARRPFPVGQHRVAGGTVIAAGAAELVRGGTENVSYMACSAIGRPYGGLGRFTRFIEAAGIDLVDLYKRARNERQLNALWNAEVARAVRENPALIGLIPRMYRPPESPVGSNAAATPD
jgi:hypothetical protein